MRKNLICIVTALLLVSLMIPSVLASWVYRTAPTPLDVPIVSSMGLFNYPPFYITHINVVGGNFANADITKTDDTNALANITLQNSASSTVVAEITFYNGSDVSYYYNKTETVSTNNDNIVYEVSGITQKEEVPAKNFKTLTVTFKYKGNNTSKRTLSSELHFNFVVDKNSIGVIAAQTAVTRFADILNNRVSGDSYQTLENYMNNRGSNFSTVSYVGNVAGASDKDSKFMQEMFTSEFLNMDLDGDGKAEPITIMIKRENLDSDVNTGDSYTYKGLFGISRTESGVEMTIYITAEGFSKNTVVVYAASFTKFADSDTWIEVVPLTKGTAEANNYSTGSFGTDNSFNTDTWKSDTNKTIDDLFKDAIKNIK